MTDDKISQKEAGYKLGKMKEHCGNCRNYLASGLIKLPNHFEPIGTCRVVEGTVFSTDWCRLYARADGQ